ncbi:MAG: hypothetical protein RL120_04855, partial [Gammaproteobacteria bacterium]
MITISIYNARHKHTYKAKEQSGENMKYPLFIRCLAAVLISAPALAQDAENSASNWLEVIQIIGTRDEARNIAGSGALIDGKQIHIEAATDINQLMKT